MTDQDLRSEIKSYLRDTGFRRIRVMALAEKYYTSGEQIARAFSGDPAIVVDELWLCDTRVMATQREVNKLDDLSKREQKKRSRAAREQAA